MKSPGEWGRKPRWGRPETGDSEEVQIYWSETDASKFAQLRVCEWGRRPRDGVDTWSVPSWLYGRTLQRLSTSGSSGLVQFFVVLGLIEPQKPSQKLAFSKANELNPRWTVRHERKLDGKLDTNVSLYLYSWLQVRYRVAKSLFK